MFEHKLNDRFCITENSDFKSEIDELFFLPAFSDLHRATFEEYFYFQLVDFHRKESYGAVCFAKKNGVWTSPGRASYGGFAFHSTLSFEEKVLFIESTLGVLKSKSNHPIAITLSPDCYGVERNAIQQNVLFRKKFRVSQSELNFFLEVDQKKFSEKVDSSNRKRLRKIEPLAPKFSKLTPNQYERAYEVIKENREKKGFPISMPFAAIAEMDEKIPGRVHFFGVYLQEELVSASLCIKINPEVLYVFYWGEKKGVEQLSPVTFLAKHIYEYAAEEKFKILDIGISTLESEPNLGLMRYKWNLGCVAGNKVTFISSET